MLSRIERNMNGVAFDYSSTSPIRAAGSVSLTLRPIPTRIAQVEVQNKPGSDADTLFKNCPAIRRNRIQGAFQSPDDCDVVGCSQSKRWTTTRSVISFPSCSVSKRVGQVRLFGALTRCGFGLILRNCKTTLVVCRYRQCAVQPRTSRFQRVLSVHFPPFADRRLRLP